MHCLKFEVCGVERSLDQVVCGGHWPRRQIRDSTWALMIIFLYNLDHPHTADKQPGFETRMHKMRWWKIFIKNIDI